MLNAALERLRSADWLMRTETQRILALLDGARGHTRAVGGIVRDTLLDHPRERADVDLATELLPEEVMARATAAGMTAYPTGIEHGTVTLKANGLLAEVTTLREDVQTDGRHALVQFGTDWQRDAERRDFTMNALYAGIDGELFDPLGGASDCLAGRVRFIGDADRRIAEDRLRVYRFFRFSASHGGEQFDPEGLAACRRSATMLGNLSAERVGAEMKRMLSLNNAARTLSAMADAGVLPLESTTLDALARYEVLGEPSFAGRLALVIAAADAESVQARWRLSNGDVEKATRVLAAAELIAAGGFNEAAYRFADALPDAVYLAALRRGWPAEDTKARLAEIAAIPVPAFPVSGGDLIKLGFSQGPALGEALEGLEHAWIESGFTLDRNALLEKLRA